MESWYLLKCTFLLQDFCVDFEHKESFPKNKTKKKTANKRERKRERAKTRAHKRNIQQEEPNRNRYKKCRPNWNELMEDSFEPIFMEIAFTSGEWEHTHTQWHFPLWNLMLWIYNFFCSCNGFFILRRNDDLI